MINIEIEFRKRSKDKNELLKSIEGAPLSFVHLRKTAPQKPGQFSEHILPAKMKTLQIFPLEYLQLIR